MEQQNHCWQTCPVPVFAQKRKCGDAQKGKKEGEKNGEIR